MTGLADDDRALSETAAVAILVGLTVTATASLGVYVLVVQGDDGPPSANFTFDYVDESSALIITHARGDELPAGNLVIEGSATATNWAAAADVNGSVLIGPGDRVQIGEGGAYGDPVRSDDLVDVYLDRGENRTLLDSWAGG